MKTKKINILFHAINGIGFGHIQRAKNIAAFLKGQNFIGALHLASSSEGKFDKGVFDNFHHLSQHISKDNFSFYEEQTYKELLEIALSLDIKIIFHDTYFVSPLVREKRFLHYYIYRLTSRDHFIKTIRMFGHFSRIYIPHSKHEFESIIPREEYKEYEDKIVFLGYVSDTSFYSKDNIGDKKNKKILISPGYGGDEDQVKDFLEYSINLVNNFLKQSKENYGVDIYAGVHKEKLLKQLEIPTEFTIHDFSSEYKKDFLYADIFIGRGGYNTVSEAMSLQKKSLLYFSDRFHESQQKRIEFFTDNLPFIKKSEKKAERDIRKLLEFEQEKYNNDYSYIKATGEDIIKDVQNVNIRPNLCIFHSSYIQDSQTFIADEIEELSKYFDISIITFRKDFKNSQFHQKLMLRCKFWVQYFDFSHILYIRDKYPYSLLYNEKEKKIYAYFLKFFSQFVKEKNISYVLSEFLGDGMFIAPFKKLHPDVGFYSAVRGRDIYNIYKLADKLEQNILKKSINAVFVRDSHMKDFVISEGFKKEDVHIIHSGKYTSQYHFYYRDFSYLNILIGGRIVEKKGIIDSLELIERLGIRGKLNINKIVLVGDTSLRDDPYVGKVLKKISSSDYLSKKVIQRGFLWRHEFMKLLQLEVNMFLGHFQASSDGDMDGIPNMITENMLTGNIVFSTLAGGIGDVVKENKTGYILSGNFEKDAQKIEDIFSSNSKKNFDKISESARKYIEDSCDITIQTQKMREIMEGNLE